MLVRHLSYAKRLQAVVNLKHWDCISSFTPPSQPAIPLCSLILRFILQSDWEAAYQASIWMAAAPDEKVAVWAVPPLSLLDHYAQRDISPGVAFLPAGSMMVRIW